MKKKKIVYIALLITLLVSTGAFQHTLAAGSQRPSMQESDESILGITNKTDQDVIVTLTLENGDPFKIVTVPSFSKNDTILKDDVLYRYEYQYCDLGNTDDKMTGEIKLTGKDYELILYPCENQSTKLVIANHMSEAVSLELLYGYEDYAFDIETGKTKVTVFSGNYVYSYDACAGETFSGDVFVKKNGTSNLILHSCEWFTAPARTYGPLNPAKYKLINHASFSVILTLIGPENYLVTVNPGVNKVNLVAGNYRYSYFLDYQLVSGTMYVPVNGTGGLTLRPAYVISNGSEDTTGDGL